jgi:hypothetical protein
MSLTDACTLVRTARERAKLSQRALAQRARTTQSVVARIELGQVSPTWHTLVRLLRAAGYELHTELIPAPRGTHALDDVARILALSPTQRLQELANVSRFVVAARRIGRAT